MGQRKRHADAAGHDESGDIDGDWSDEDAATSEDEYAGEEATDDESAGEDAAPEDEAEAADGADGIGGDDAAAAEEEEGAGDGGAESDPDPAAEEQTERDACVDGSNTDEAGSGDPVSATPAPQPSPASSSASPTAIGRPQEQPEGPGLCGPPSALRVLDVEPPRPATRALLAGRTTSGAGAETCSEAPLGWNAIGPARSRQDALDYIKEQLAEMRPQSLRRQMKGMARSAAGKPGG